MPSLRPNVVISHILNCFRYDIYRVRNGNIEVECPECGADGKFAVHVTKGLWGCWTCGLSGSIRSSILGDDRSRWAPVRVAVLEMSGGVPGGVREGVVLPRDDISRGFWQIGATSGFLDPAVGQGEPLPGLVRRAYEYALFRGLTPTQITDYKVSVRAFDPRLYFPVWDDRDQMTFWMGRAINNTVEPKTLEPGHGASKPLYGLHVRSLMRQPILLVEGVFDHFVTPGSVATMGSFLSDFQIGELAACDPPWVGIVWDPDARGKAENAASRLFRAGIPTRVYMMETEKDPADLGGKIMDILSYAIRQHEIPKRLLVQRVLMPV